MAELNRRGPGRPRKTSAAALEAAEEAADLLARAKAAQARRLATPMATVGTRTPIPQKQLVELYAPECVGHLEGKKYVQPEWHPFWASEDRARDLVAQGYEPKQHPDGGWVREPMGNILYRLPQELYERDLRVPAAYAANRLQTKSDDAKENPGAVTESITELGPDGGVAQPTETEGG